MKKLTNKLTNKVNKFIRLLHKLKMVLLKRALVTISKSFIRPQSQLWRDYPWSGINESFHDSLESIQYNCAIRVASRERFYHKLCLKSLYIVYETNAYIGFVNYILSTRDTKISLYVISTSYYSTN